MCLEVIRNILCRTFEIFGFRIVRECYIMQYFLELIIAVTWG